MAMATDTEPSTEPSTRAFRAAIETIAGYVESFQPGRYSGSDAAELVGDFSRGKRLCAAGETLAAKRAADANQPARQGHRSAADWLASVTGDSYGDAKDVLELGRALETHPGIDDAVRKGKLSRGKAKLIAGAVEVNPGAEDELVEAAEHETCRQTKDRTQRARHQGRSRMDDNAKYQELHRDRSCKTWTDASTGAFRLDARLTPDAGAALLAALRRETDQVFNEARKAGTHESPDAYAADALVNLVTRAGSPCGSSGTGTDGKKKTTSSVRARVLVRVDLDALRTGVVGPGGICEIPGVGPIPVDTAYRLMGEGLCHLVITDGIDVTTICRLDRTIPAALQAALDERDATCCVPGCDVATGLETDHYLVDFADHGPTALSNLAKLCSHHHDLKTHKGFTLAGGPGHWQWIPPTGNSDPPDRPNGDPDPASNRSPGQGPRPPQGWSDDPSADPRLFPKRE